MNNNHPSTAKRGGLRPGAGRKSGSGLYGEPTSPVRVPDSQVPVIVDFLEAYRNRHNEPSAVGEMYRPAMDKRTVRLPLYC